MLPMGEPPKASRDGAAPQPVRTPSPNHHPDSRIPLDHNRQNRFSTCCPDHPSSVSLRSATRRNPSARNDFHIL